MSDAEFEIEKLKIRLEFSEKEAALWKKSYEDMKALCDENSRLVDKYKALVERGLEPRFS